MKLKILFLLLCGHFLFNASALAARSPEDHFNYLVWDQKDHPWFEWWYTKVTVPETNESFFVTLGMVNPEKNSGRTGKAIVSIGDFKSNVIETEYLDLSSFSAKKDTLDVRVGSTSFSGNHFSGRVHESSFDFTIQNKWSFNAMGWAMFIPNLTNIAWFPAQADAVCTGKFETLDPQHQKKTVEFNRAPCYQDRNWGESFPRWWAWIVSNHFNEDQDATLAVGGGVPKILGHELYEGVSIGFRYHKKNYTFRPNDLAKVSTEICFGKWKVQAEDPYHRIEINAYAPPEAFMDLPFLTPQGFMFHDLETLNGHLEVRLFERATPNEEYKQVVQLTSDLAGIEFGSAKTNKDNLFGGCLKF